MDWETATELIFKIAQKASNTVPGYVKLGYACNNNCLFCTAAWKKKYGDRDTRTIMDEIKRIVDQDKVSTMIYSGGEPTIRTDLIDIFRHAKSLGIDYQNIQTNTRKLSDQGYLTDLRDAGLTSCFVSVHGSDASVHDRLTRSPGAFEQTCSGLANLDHLGMPFVTNTVICTQNYRQLSELVTFLGETFRSILHIKLSYPRLQGGAVDNLSTVIVPVWEVAQFVREAIDQGKKIGGAVETEFIPICLLGARYQSADIFFNSRVNLSDLAFSDSNYSRPQGAVFYEVCSHCEVVKYCCGFDKLHDETFGDNSCFNPVSFMDLAP